MNLMSQAQWKSGKVILPPIPAGNLELINIVYHNCVACGRVSFNFSFPSYDIASASSPKEYSTRQHSTPIFSEEILLGNNVDTRKSLFHSIHTLTEYKSIKLSHFWRRKLFCLA